MSLKWTSEHEVFEAGADAIAAAHNQAVEIARAEGRREAMKIPSIEFPVGFDDIPAHVKALAEFIEGCRASQKIASELIRLVRSGCSHEKAQRGYNERDGSWMNPCPHCGAVE